MFPLPLGIGIFETLFCCGSLLIGMNLFLIILVKELEEGKTTKQKFTFLLIITGLLLW